MQCHPTQPAIDCVAPLIWAQSLDETIQSSSLGFIQIQTKNRAIAQDLIVPTQPELDPSCNPTFTISMEYDDDGENLEDGVAVATIIGGKGSSVYRRHNNHFQLNIKGLTGLRLSDEEKNDVRTLLDLNSTIEAFPRASNPQNFRLMRGLKPSFKVDDQFAEWAAVDSWDRP